MLFLLLQFVNEVDLAKLELTKPKPQNQLLLFELTLLTVNCAHEYNYVVRFPIQPVKKFTLLKMRCYINT